MQQYLQFDSHPTIGHGFEFQETTMQVPCGQYSILSELHKKKVTAAEAITYLALNHASSWNSGMTWYMPGRELARALGPGMSIRYVRSTLDNLIDKDWIVPIPTSNKRKRYRLVHHLCTEEDVPVDPDGKPLKFAVPRGTGGPFERLYAGDISWKACLGWIVLKLNSDWETGETNGCTMLEFAKRCRFRPATAVQSVKELRAAEMLVKLSKPSEKSVFQLYPKPYPQPLKRDAQPNSSNGDNEPEIDPNYWYSSKGKYRRSRETLQVEFRVSRFSRKWKPVPDRDLHKIPEEVMNEFEMSLAANQSILSEDVHYP